MPKPPRDEDQDQSVLFVRGMPREMLARLKAAAALSHKTLGEYLKELFAEHLQDLERKGQLPKGK